ncbi:HNH endonuclease [Exiguobacterium sp. R-39]|uniref:HNH endonuclease n=1 Tax=Exiguobacterium sp. R-39 TaxID=3416708 RepID=UPI003CEF9491
MNNIPDNINRKHVISAIQKINVEGIPERRNATGYDLLYKGMYYPPKYIISIANIFANGEEYPANFFYGGKKTNDFLRNLGFDIVKRKNEQDNDEVNTWIFQGNPKVFDIDNYVKDNKLIWWSLRQENYKDKVQLQDVVFIWRSNAGKRGTGGILAKTKVVGLPKEKTGDENSKGYWYTNSRSNEKFVIELEVLQTRLEESLISRSEILNHPTLNDLSILKFAQQTNYLLPSEHADDLHELWDSNFIKVENRIDPSILDDLESDIIQDTEKEQVIKARIGHSIFKKKLLSVEKKCRLCNVSDERLLIASHIKPWSKSNNKERLDSNNGLLFCPNHDILFDKGFISFKNDREILISSTLDEESKIFMNINENMHIEMNDSQKAYMKWHRDNLFRK